MNAFKHMMLAPLWMNNMQPHSTPGWQATWDDGHYHAPLSHTLAQSAAGQGDMPVLGKTANFTAALEWFKPRYAAFKADPTNTISVADVLAAWPGFFSGGSAVVRQMGGPQAEPCKEMMGSVTAGAAAAAAGSGMGPHCSSSSSTAGAACQASFA